MVVQTGIPIEVVVVRGIDSESFITMDIGKSRSFGDVLFVAKFEQPTRLAPTTSWVWRYLTGRIMGQIGSHEQLLATLDRHPQISDSVEFVHRLDRTDAGPGYQALATAMHYLTSRADQAAADNFIERFRTGLRIESATDPVRVLREQIMANQTAKGPNYTSAQVLWLFARAWNSQQEGGEARQKFR